MAGHLKLAGEWEGASVTNLDEMLQKLGVGFMKRKLAASMKPFQNISFSDNKMTVSIPNRGDKTIPLDGSEFEGEMLEKKTTGSASVDDAGVITVKGKVGDMDLLTVRKLNENGQMVLSTTIDGVECVRVFNRKK